MSGLHPVLATSFQDWVERLGPVVLLVFFLGVYALRARDRRRGADEDDDLP